MATGNAAQAPAQASAPESQAQNSTQFPKRDLASWWKNFKRNARKEEEKGPSFGTAAQLGTMDTANTRAH